MWLDDIEPGAMEQVKHLANLPFVYRHVAIMPDSHLGYGMPIGGVIATEDVIIPNAVGVDIGCGMCAVKTSLTELTVDQLKVIMGKIREAIPVGFNHHKEKQDESLMPRSWDGMHVGSGEYPIVSDQYEKALTQIGTLGGGNHFIEIQKGSDGHIWIMIHSGSRNIGLQVAKHYNNLAVELNAKWHTVIPKEWELAFLPLDTPEGQAYLREMTYCVDFAYANRYLMMTRAMEIVEQLTDANFIAIGGDTILNIAHNYAALENHFGKNVWVHRKGATQAYEGQLGIIPGSQGTKSYIVRGKGARESFMSCSHGAGRRLGRKAAQKTLNLDEERAKLDRQGILHAIRGISDLDEASGAYKDITTVMKNQEDLVDIVTELTPLGVIKG